MTVRMGDKQPHVPLHALLARWGQPGSSRGLTYKQRVLLLIDAARNGDPGALEQLSHSTGCLRNEDVFHAAARTGQHDVCKWLLQQGCPLEREGALVQAVAADAGHTRLCAELVEAGLQPTLYVRWEARGKGGECRRHRVAPRRVASAADPGRRVLSWYPGLKGGPVKDFMG